MLGLLCLGQLLGTILSGLSGVCNTWYIHIDASTARRFFARVSSLTGRACESLLADAPGDRYSRFKDSP